MGTIVANGTATNINIGTANLYILDPYVAASDPVSGVVIDWTGWDVLGFKDDEGLKLNFGGTWNNVFAEGFGAAIIRHWVAEQATAEFILQETNLLQRAHAIPGSTYTVAAVPGTNSNVLDVGDKATAPGLGEVAFGFEAEDTATGLGIVGFFPKATMGESTIWQQSKLTANQTPVKIEALADPTRAAGQTLARFWEITTA